MRRVHLYRPQSFRCSKHVGAKFPTPPECLLSPESWQICLYPVGGDEIGLPTPIPTTLDQLLLLDLAPSLCGVAEPKISSGMICQILFCQQQQLFDLPGLLPLVQPFSFSFYLSCE